MSALWTALGRSGSTAEQLEPARGDPVEGLVQEQVQQMSGQRGRLVAGVWDLWKVRRKLHALAALGCDRGPGTAGLWCTGENMSHPGGGGGGGGGTTLPLYYASPEPWCLSQPCIIVVLFSSLIFLMVLDKNINQQLRE